LCGSLCNFPSHAARGDGCWCGWRCPRRQNAPHVRGFDNALRNANIIGQSPTRLISRNVGQGENKRPVVAQTPSSTPSTWGTIWPPERRTYEGCARTPLHEKLCFCQNNFGWRHFPRYWIKEGIVRGSDQSTIFRRRNELRNAQFWATNRCFDSTSDLNRGANTSARRPKCPHLADRALALDLPKRFHGTLTHKSKASVGPRVELGQSTL